MVIIWPTCNKAESWNGIVDTYAINFKAIIYDCLIANYVICFINTRITKNLKQYKKADKDFTEFLHYSVIKSVENSKLRKKKKRNVNTLVIFLNIKPFLNHLGLNMERKKIVVRLKQIMEKIGGKK